MIKICLSGIGRAGGEVAKYLLNNNDVKIVSACCSPDSVKRGRDLGEIINCRDTGIIVETAERIDPFLYRTFPDVVIDFSAPSVAIKNAEIFSKMKINIVMGTTGFSTEEELKLFSIIKKYNNGLVYAPNITIGVNIMMFLTDLATRLLSNYDAEIIEMHHRHKKDKPSGTAKKISNGIKTNNLNRSFDNDIPISSIRAGGIVGYHKVILAGENDRLEITHESLSRSVFAEGSLCAAKFIYQKIGIFEMRDIFNFEELLAEYFSEKQEYNQEIALNM